MRAVEIVGGIVGLVIRLVGGAAAVGCFLAGLWSVFGDPARGLGLMALGIVLGVVFGRYPAGATVARADQTGRISGPAEH